MIEGQWTIAGAAGWVSSPELEPGANTVSIQAVGSVGQATVPIIAIDIHGNQSRGIRHFIEWGNWQEDW